jgi:bifunctional DNA-binding transcriptional regulator/antitoxin component of YhaV-PrlF toxin-antitoxin module
VPRRPKPPSPRLIDPRNRVALTRQVRQALGVEMGDYVTFEVVEGEVFLRRLDLTIARPRRLAP